MARHSQCKKAALFAASVLVVGVAPALLACGSDDESRASGGVDPGVSAGVGGVAPMASAGQSGTDVNAPAQGPGTGGGGGAATSSNQSPNSEVVQPAGLAGTSGTEPGSSGDGSTSGAAEDPAPVTGSCPATTELQPGDTTRTLLIGGIERSFLVHAPPGYDGTARVPVVFDFHGLGGNSNQQKNLSRWDDVADANGFISVYPQGIDNAWNAGLCCSEGSDDVAFVRAIIEDLTASACIDTKRVFSSGCSNGGGMSYKLACEASDVIAAVAPVDFDCVDGSGCSDCAPQRPITVVQFRGTNDQLVPYEGNGPFAGAQQNLATWGEINECTGDAATAAQNDACEAFPMCGSGAQTVLCTVQGGTHCGSYGSFMIAEVAWGILQNQQLP